MSKSKSNDFRESAGGGCVDGKHLRKSQVGYKVHESSLNTVIEYLMLGRWLELLKVAHPPVTDHFSVSIQYL